MFRPIIISLFCLTLFPSMFCQNLNGVFLIDSCKCNSSAEACDPSGPFIFNQKRSTLAVRYGSQQVGVGSSKDNQVDLYINQNRCKGLWNEKTHTAALKCLHQGGIVCSTSLRCLSGSCLDDVSIVVSSSSFSALSILSFVFMISLLIIVV
ncbi:unnamed protein product [Adineta ricciae]|uniref:Uncharacterized protein n=1 Tax=Adineta ricciae TaxID=249248 RepID=A0A815ESE7_ADIRI|nr:unnamed protein product [Adineta ricciae]